MGLGPNPVVPPHQRIYNVRPSQAKQVCHKNSRSKTHLTLFHFTLCAKVFINYFLRCLLGEIILNLILMAGEIKTMI